MYFYHILFSLLCIRFLAHCVPFFGVLEAMDGYVTDCTSVFFRKVRPDFYQLSKFRTENHIKSNLIVFVTAQIIDPTGRPVRQGTESTPNVTGGPPVTDPSLLPPLVPGS